MIKIQSHSFYRPYSTHVNGVERIVKEINIYDENGIVISTKQGWLDRRGYGDVKELILVTDKELLLRRKEKFDDEVYIINIKSDWNGEKQCALYIPNSLVNFQKVGRELKFNYNVVDTWESDILDSRVTIIRSEFKLNVRLRELESRFNEIKSGYDLRIENNGVEKLIDELYDLRGEYELEVNRIKEIDLDKLEG